MSAVLEGKVAVITGGGRGIGRAIAIAFAQAGARLLLVARTAAQLEEVADRCREAGAEAGVEAADVSDPASVRELFASVRQRFGRLDCLVNCAGVYGPIGPLEENDLDAWSRAVSVNLLGTVYTCHQAVPLLTESGGGSIINLSGGGATAPLPRFTAYAATKAAVVRFTETLAEEVSGAGIRVNAIAPGAVNTTLQDAVLAAGEAAGPLYERISALRESGAGGTPPEVPAALAVFLASDASAHLTGRLISAPHDPWREWDAGRLEALRGTPWFTLRRIDPHTIGPLEGRRP